MATDKFRPVLIGGSEAKTVGEMPKANPTLQERMIELLDSIKKEVEEGSVVGLIAIVVNTNGSQDEIAALDELDYSLIGRLHTMATNVSLSISAPDEDDWGDEDDIP